MDASKFISSFVPLPTPLCRWPSIQHTSPDKPDQNIETKQAIFACSGVLKGVTGKMLQDSKVVVNLAEEFRTCDYENGFFGPKYAGSMIERFVKFLIKNPAVTKKILRASFLVAPVGKPCRCGTRCTQIPQCSKTQTPNLTFLIGALKNLRGNLDYYWVNPVQLLFRQTEEVECLSNARIHAVALDLTRSIKTEIDPKYAESFVMNFSRGKIEDNLQLLTGLERAGFPRSSFCDVILSELGSATQASVLEPFIGLFAQILGTRLQYEAKEGYSVVALILDFHSSTALIFPAICHAMGLLQHVQLICYHRGACTPSPKLSELFVPLQLCDS